MRIGVAASFESSYNPRNETHTSYLHHFGFSKRTWSCARTLQVNQTMNIEAEAQRLGMRWMCMFFSSSIYITSTQSDKTIFFSSSSSSPHGSPPAPEPVPEPAPEPAPAPATLPVPCETSPAPAPIRHHICTVSPTHKITSPYKDAAYEEVSTPENSIHTHTHTHLTPKSFHPFCPFQSPSHLFLFPRRKKKNRYSIHRTISVQARFFLSHSTYIAHTEIHSSKQWRVRYSLPNTAS